MIKEYCLWWAKSKMLLILTVVWGLITLVKTSHYPPLSSNSPMTLLFLIWVLTPFYCLWLLVMMRDYKGKRLQNLFLLRAYWWERAALFILPTLLLLDLYNTSHNFQSYGTFLSVGLMFLIALVISKRNGHLGNLQSMLIGIILSFGFMFSWEVMYRMMVFFKSSFSAPAWGHDIYTNIIMVLPSILLLLFYKPKFQYITWLLGGLFALLILVWIASGMWTLVIYKNGAWTTENWSLIMHLLCRFSKIVLGLAAGSVIFEVWHDKPVKEISEIH